MIKQPRQRPQASWFVDLAEAIQRRPSRKNSAFGREISRTELGIEVLEDRSMLSGGAIGSFERQGVLGSEVDVIVNPATRVNLVTPVPLNEAVSSYSDTFAQGLVSAAGSDASGAGSFRSRYEATNLTPIGGSVAAPFVSTANHFQVSVQGDVHALTPVGTGSAVHGDYAYVPDPAFTGNLVANSHVFIAIYGLNTGTASLNSYVFNVWAGNENVGVAVHAVSSNSFRVETSTGLDYISTGGVNIHLYQAGGAAPLTHDSQFHLNYSLLSLTGESGQSQWSVTTASWGYMTAEGADIQSGDFNYDGSVDDGDFDLWKVGSPQADGDLDGDVDEDDYGIWAANANAIVVSTNVDENDGNYAAGDLSLREAIALAANAGHPGSDVIAFDSSLIDQTITLAMGQLLVAATNPVKILGPGADHLTIHGNNSATNLLNVASASTISNLKLTGTATGGAAVQYTASNNLLLESLEITGNGYGVRHSGSGSGQLSLIDSLVANSNFSGIARTTHAPPSETASVIVTRSVIRDNGAKGIDLRNVDVSIDDTEIIGNNGGGILAKDDGDMQLLSVAISGSTIAENDGDGIAVTGSGTPGYSVALNLFNSTISGNNGVGLTATHASAALTNVTVTQNEVVSGTAGLYAGAGATITMHNTIVAQNFSGGVSADLGRTVTTPVGSFAVGTSSYNLIGAVGNSGITSSQNNIILGSGVDAGLLALGDYGGRTRTHALREASLAIDAGDNAKATAIGLLFDQRGDESDRIIDWDNDLDVRVDIGAFELALGEWFS